MIKKLKLRAKKRRRNLNESLITFNRLRLKGKELQSVDKKFVVWRSAFKMLNHYRKVLGDIENV